MSNVQIIVYYYSIYDYLMAIRLQVLWL